MNLLIKGLCKFLNFFKGGTMPKGSYNAKKKKKGKKKKKKKKKKR